jgi:hypothetical protein
MLHTLPLGKIHLRKLVTTLPTWFYHNETQLLQIGFWGVKRRETLLCQSSISPAWRFREVNSGNVCGAPWDGKCWCQSLKMKTLLSSLQDFCVCWHYGRHFYSFCQKSHERVFCIQLKVDRRSRDGALSQLRVFLGGKWESWRAA